MLFRILTLILLVISPLAFSQGRKPAVEDFVGIEVEHPEATPQGTEALFNFEKDIDKFEENKDKPFKASADSAKISEPVSMTTFVTIALVLSLPALVWFLMMNRLRHKAQLENVSNIEVLEKYRKQREETKKNQDETRKAS